MINLSNFMSKFRITVILISLGLIVFALANPDLLMQIFFWTGGVLVALGVWLGPQSDNRYSSGYKDNSDPGILMFTLMPGVIFLALGGLLYWLTS